MAEGTKVCTKCDEAKPLDAFYVRSNRKEGQARVAECKTCISKRGRANATRNMSRTTIDRPEECSCSICRRTLPGTAFAANRSKASGVQSICLECQRDRRCGLQPGEYDRILQEQGGVCAICSGPCQRGGALSVDHDHVTGRVRALLCQNCNAGIGMLGDDPDRLLAAAAYLLRFKNTLEVNT